MSGKSKPYAGGNAVIERWASLAILVLLMLTPFPDEMRGYRYGSGCQWSHFEVRQERGEPLPSVIVNEAYPDPDMDIDGNGIADQEDEFVELRNLYPGPLSLDGMSLTDGTSTFILDGIIMDGDSILMLNRSQTGLKLGRDDSVTLLNGSGGVLDSFSYSGAFKGVSYQRSSTDIERWMTTKVPTPGTVNLPSPQMLINEVMVDPEGANGGKQWVELLNHGHGWNLQGFTLGNHEGVRVELPSVHVNAGGRVLIHLGPPRTCCPHPPDIPSSSRTSRIPFTHRVTIWNSWTGMDIPWTILPGGIPPMWTGPPEKGMGAAGMGGPSTMQTGPWSDPVVTIRFP